MNESDGKRKPWYKLRSCIVSNGNVHLNDLVKTLLARVAADQLVEQSRRFVEEHLENGVGRFAFDLSLFDGEIGPQLLFRLQLPDQNLVDPVALPLRPLGQLVLALQARSEVELHQHQLFNAIYQLLRALQRFSGPGSIRKNIKQFPFD